MGAEKYYEIGANLELIVWKNQSKQAVEEYNQKLLEHLENIARNFYSNGCRVKSIEFKKGSVILKPWVNLVGSMYCDLNPVRDVIVYEGGQAHDGEREFLQQLLNRIYQEAKNFMLFKKIRNTEVHNHAIRVKTFRIAVL